MFLYVDNYQHTKNIDKWYIMLLNSAASCNEKVHATLFVLLTL
jgi:hypothetical protein